jgi:uncharacterized protein YeaO (DUF488 family)
MSSSACHFAGILGNAPFRGRADDLDQFVFEGNFFVQEVYFFHKRSRTVILADFIQNHPIVTGKPILNVLWKLLASVSGMAASRWTSGCLSLIGRSRADRSKGCFHGISRNSSLLTASALRKTQGHSLAAYAIPHLLPGWYAKRNDFACLKHLYSYWSSNWHPAV